MRLRVTGIQAMDYMNRQGKHVVGTSVHGVILDEVVEGLVGQKVTNVWFSEGNLKKPAIIGVGDELTIYYNRMGGIDYCQRVAASGGKV